MKWQHASFGRTAAPTKRRTLGPFAVATYTAIVIALAFVAATVSASAVLPLFAAAILCGWAEVDGLCGTSHVCALTPLRAMDPRGRLWFRAASAYVLAGIATAACIGALLGSIGLILGGWKPQSLIALSGLALLLAARELGIIRFALPQVPRQTNRMWAIEFGFVGGAAMWGAHIGLGFATVIRHGGIFALSLYAALSAPLDGALLMSTYWLGRCSPIVLTPLLSPKHGDARHLADMVLLDPDSYLRNSPMPVGCFT